MALGFTSHYQGEQQFGALTAQTIASQEESTGSVASDNVSNVISDSQNSVFDKVNNCDSCDFSVSVPINYADYAECSDIASSSSETAGSVAYVGGSDSSFSAGVSSFSGGGDCGGASCASFTC